MHLKISDLVDFTIFDDVINTNVMNPKSNAIREVIYVLSFSLIVAVILTYLVFAEGEDSDSSIMSSALFIFLPIGIIAWVSWFIVKRFTKKESEKLENRWRFFIFLDLIMHELIANRMSLIIILLLIVLFLGLDQAQELLLHLADEPLAPPFFYSVLMLLALVSWYSTRFMYLHNIRIFKFRNFLSDGYKAHLSNKNENINHVRAILPKILGLVIILVPTLFMLKLYMENVPETSDRLVILITGAMFFGLSIIIYAFSKVRFYEILKGWLARNKWFIWLFLVLLVGLGVNLYMTNNMNSPKKIPWLYFSGLVVAVLYFLITSMEIEKILLTRQKNPTNLIKYAILIGSILVSTFFIVFNFWPLSFQVNGLTILLSGLVFYSFLAYFLIIVGGKFKLPLLTLLIVMGITASIKFAPNSDLHDVRLTPTASKYNPSKRVDIHTYIAKWFEHNEANIKRYQEQNKKFPIVFVTSEGGGSRAALWTLLAHDTLEKTIPNYYNHIFSMSGASGGNTGNSFYLALQEIREKDKPLDVGLIADTIFQNDFVSTDIGMLFGLDAWQSLWYFGLPDRSEILQQKWENAFDKARLLGYSDKENPLKRDFLSFWYNTTSVDTVYDLRFVHPLFLLSTTHIQSGDHATMSAVRLPGFVPQNMDLLEKVYEKHDKKSIPLSSGALMNSRFPIVCPSGKIDSVGNFVDAGYYDNFGAAETRAAIQAVIDYLEKPDNGLNKNSFNLVHLVFRNGLPDRKLDHYTKVRSNRYGENGDTLMQECYLPYQGPTESIVPIFGLVRAAFAHPNRELAEIHYLVDNCLYFDLKRTPIRLNEDDTTTVIPILPLSRHLSNLAVRSMHARINQIMDDSMHARLNAIFDLDTSLIKGNFP